MGMGWLQSQDRQARVGSARVMGRRGHGYSDHAGTQGQRQSRSAAPEPRGGLQRRFLTAPLHNWAVSPAMAPGCTAAPRQSFVAFNTGSQTPGEGGRGCSNTWWAQDPDAHIAFKAPEQGIHWLLSWFWLGQS